MVKRWGMKGGWGSHGATKNKRRIGSLGGGGVSYYECLKADQFICESKETMVKIWNRKFMIKRIDITP